MRLTVFWQRMADHFGAGYADTFARDHVMTELGGRTVHEALDAGWEAKDVWRAVCAAMDVPYGKPLTRHEDPGAVTDCRWRGRDLAPWHPTDETAQVGQQRIPARPDAARRPAGRGRRRAGARMPRWLPRAMVLALALIACFQLGSWAFHQLIGLLINILIAFFLALAIEPAVSWMAARGMRRGLATFLVFLGVLIVGAGLRRAARLDARGPDRRHGRGLPRVPRLGDQLDQHAPSTPS